MSTSEMKLIFVSAPYSGDGTRKAIQQNIVNAECLSIQLFSKGWAVITPPKNTAHYEKYERTLKLGYEFWLKVYLHILEKCDAIIMAVGWEKSKGAKGEHKRAKKLGIPIFYEEGGLPSPGDLK